MFFLALCMWKGKFAPSSLVLSDHRGKNTFVSPFWMQPFSRKPSGSCWQSWSCRGCSGYFFCLFWLQGLSLSSSLWLTLPLLPVKMGTSFSFCSLNLFQKSLPFSGCSWDGTKAGGQRANVLICETNRPGGPGGYGNPESLFSWDQPRNAPSSSAESECVSTSKVQGKQEPVPSSAGGPLQPNRSQLWPQRPLNDVIWEGVLQPPEGLCSKSGGQSCKMSSLLI